jgi:hypothetical protein
MLGIGLVTVARLPWDRRFQQHVIMFALVSAAVAGLMRDNSRASLSRLSAFDQRNYLRAVKARRA